MKTSKDINWALIFVIGSLLVIGLINLYSALKVWGEASYMRLFWSQIVWVAVGIVIAIFLSFLNYHFFERFSYLIYFTSLILLALVLVGGKVVAGHRSWLGIGGIGIQPSEFAKVAIIFVFAKYFSINPKPDGFGLIDLIKPFLMAVIPMALVLLQGDLGSALFFMLIFFSFAWFAKMRRNVVLIIAITAIAGSIFSYHYVLSDYQKARLVTFINPAYDVKGSGYHLMQSRIAVGSGKVWGKGYLKGNINKLRYLPEKHTDFIFPVLAEEWGFAGCFVVLAFYYALLAMTIEIAKESRERFGIFMAMGIGAYFFWQIAINLGGVLGIMPMTGVTLPFLSYGGSSIISLMIVAGILISISRKRFLF